MKFLLSLFLIVLTLPLVAQEMECSEFKIGKFRYTDPDYADLVTIRKDSIQIDSYPSLGWEMKNRITWLSDCTYQTECISVNEASLESLIGITYIIQIIAIRNDTIVCRAESDGITIDKEMVKVKAN